MSTNKDFNIKPSDGKIFSLNSSEVARRDPDKEIFIKNILKDDPKKGCELLFKHYYQVLCSHAVRFVYSKEIAQDLVSDVFCAIWQNKLYLTIATSYRAYLFTAVRNRALKHLSKEFGKVDHAVDLANLCQESTLPTPQQAMHYTELSTRIENAIRMLTPQTQKVFLMHRFEGKNYEAIAAELDISKKTVEAHISKALNFLRDAISDL